MERSTQASIRNTVGSSDDHSSTRALLRDAAERAANYLESVGKRSVVPSAAAVAALARLDGPLPAHGSDAKQTLALLDELVSPATMAMAGPRFFGFVIGGSLPGGAGGELAGRGLGPERGVQQHHAGRGAAGADRTALADRPVRTAAGDRRRVRHRRHGCQFHRAGGGATGGTGARVGWNVEADGLFGAPPITVIAGDEAHPTLLKSLGMLGLGRSRIVRVADDGQGRMRPDALPEIAGPTILCLQAGNVNTGAFDPFGPLIERAHRDGAWVHVDGAFGLWAKAATSLRHLVDGMEAADSWATDAHKWLNVPYDSGLAFVRDPHALKAAMAITAEYLPQAGAERNPSDFTPELSRRARGVEVWAALHALGRSGIGGDDRAQLPPGTPLCSGPVRQGLRRAQ